MEALNATNSPISPTVTSSLDDQRDWEMGEGKLASSSRSGIKIASPRSSRKRSNLSGTTALTSEEAVVKVSNVTPQETSLTANQIIKRAAFLSSNVGYFITSKSNVDAFRTTPPTVMNETEQAGAEVGKNIFILDEEDRLTLAMPGSEHRNAAEAARARFIEAVEGYYGKEIVNFITLPKNLTSEEVKHFLEQADAIVDSTIKYLTDHPYVAKEAGRTVVLGTLAKKDLEEAEKALNELTPPAQHLISAGYYLTQVAGSRTANIFPTMLNNMMQHAAQGAIMGEELGGAVGKSTDILSSGSGGGLLNSLAKEAYGESIGELFGSATGTAVGSLVGLAKGAAVGAFVGIMVAFGVMDPIEEISINAFPSEVPKAKARDALEKFHQVGEIHALAQAKKEKAIKNIATILPVVKSQIQNIMARHGSAPNDANDLADLAKLHDRMTRIIKETEEEKVSQRIDARARLPHGF